MSNSGLLEQGAIVSQPSSAIAEKLSSLLSTPQWVIPSQQAEALAADLGISKAQLMIELISVAKARALVHQVNPISNYYVGSVALGSSGSLYLGTNLEFVGKSLIHTVHSEQFCTTNAMGHHEKGLVALAVSAEPCGYCRQFLNELDGAQNLRILIPEQPAASLADLLPHSFGPHHLGVETGVMGQVEPPMTLAKLDSELVEYALKASSHSYAPYSHSPCGVALKTRQGQIFQGWYIENAAFNPCMCPLQAALIMLLASGGQYDDVIETVLVEKGQALLSHISNTRSLLSAVAPESSFSAYLAK